MLRTQSRGRGRLDARSDDGVALVGVLGMLMVLTLFLLATLAFTLQNTKPTRKDQDAKAALAAAQAGIDDYVARLNGTPTGYWRLGNTDAANPALLPTTSTLPGRRIPGTGTAGAFYRYSVLSTTADVASLGQVKIRAVGTSRDVSRTLTATLSPSGFLQFIYHTDLETVDPALFSAESSSLRTQCALYYRDNRSTSNCNDIQFATGDVITGPLHTNDSILVGGTVTFSSPKTETSWPTTGSSRNPPSAIRLWRGSPTPLGNLPVYAPIVQIPQENTELRAIAADTTSPEGCIYTGATKITFTGATMTVLSPNTTTAPSRCYNTAASDKRVPQTGLTIPPVIYVEDKTGTCVKQGTVTVTLGYPLAGEYVGAGGANYSGDYTGPKYTCAEGTAYVQGTIDGASTLATTQDVVVVGNLNYTSEANTSDDVLGLIPGHFTWVYHPVDEVSGDYVNMLSASAKVTQIDAASLSVKDSFVVQNWDMGAKVTTDDATKLRVFGAIAQKFRGAVGTGGSSSSGTGYIKNYIYDNRFQRGVQPPYYLLPVSAQWKAAQVTDG